MTAPIVIWHHLATSDSDHDQTMRCPEDNVAAILFQQPSLGLDVVTKLVGLWVVAGFTLYDLQVTSCLRQLFLIPNRIGCAVWIATTHICSRLEFGELASTWFAHALPTLPT